MFKVICISGVKAGQPCIYESGHHSVVFEDEVVFVGETYTVVNVEKIRGCTFYTLAEKGRNSLYNANDFIPCSDIDETERLEAYQEERATTLDHLLMEYAEHMPEIEMEPGAFERVWKGIVKKEEGWA